MPLKGIVFIFTIAILYVIFDYKKIYQWLTSAFSDDNNTNDDDN
jgi:hypothetical protein